MSTCLGKMMIEEDHEIAPQLKKMKLSSDCSDYEFARSSLQYSDLQKEMKFVYPYLNDEKIKEIIEKSENNSQNAKKIVNEMNQSEIRKNKDFVNLHQESRKRRINEIGSLDFLRDRQSNMSQNITGSNLTNNITQPQTPLRRKFVFTRNSPVCTDEDVEKIISETSLLSSRQEIKDYLKKTISNLIKSKDKKSEDQASPKRGLISDQSEELRRANEKLMEDNKDMKQALLYLFQEREKEKKKKEQSFIAFTKEIERLREELKNVKSNNEYYAMAFRQLENSNKNDFNSPNDIC